MAEEEKNDQNIEEGAANAQAGGAEDATDTPQEGQNSQGSEAAAEGTGEGQQEKPAKPSKPSGRSGKNAKDLPGGDQAGGADSSQEGKEPQGGKPDAAGGDKQLNELVKAYSKLYPKCRKFHVTADRMVFLENDLNAAQFHQRTLPDGQVESLKRVD